jgi:putative ABC transport system permease protein
LLHEKLRKVDGFQPDRFTMWHFAAFTLDPDMRNNDLVFFCIATIPEKLPTMVDGLEGLDPKLCEKMQRPPRSGQDNIGILMGPERMKKLNVRVGDILENVKCMSHREGFGARRNIEMKFEIVGELPGESRWAQGAFMDYEYLDRVLKEKKSELDGQVNLVWLRTRNQRSAEEVAALIERHIPEVKCEQASNAISRFLEPMRDLLNGVKYLLVPAILVVMTVIVANAIGITVRERRMEIAVMKVLGYDGGRILVLVLGEALLIGCLGGLFGGAGTYFLINHLVGGIKIPIGFFPVFYVPPQALWWGPLLGGATAFLGSALPAWNARGVKVSEVFAKVA